MDRLAFSYIPNGSLLQRANPTFKLLYLILFSILISTSGNYEIYFYTLFLLILGFKSKVNLLKSLISMPFMLLIALFIALTELIKAQDILSIARETVSFLTLLILAILFISTTDVIELSASLGHYLSPILGKKAWKLSSSIMITLALLPMIFSSATTMLQARRSRCGNFFQHPIKNMTEYTISLILILFKKAEIFEDALLSRSFSDTAPRMSKKATTCDKITFICIVLFTTAIFLARRMN